MYLKYAFLVRNNFVFYVWFMNFLVLKDSIQLRKSFFVIRFFVEEIITPFEVEE
jgi:hypothetical protein